MPANPNVKSPGEMTVNDFSVDPSFTLGQESAGKAVSAAARMFAAFHTEFPEFELPSYPSAPPGTLFDQTVTPKIASLVLPDLLPGMRERFINKAGSDIAFAG